MTSWTIAIIIATTIVVTAVPSARRALTTAGRRLNLDQLLDPHTDPEPHAPTGHWTAVYTQPLPCPVPGCTAPITAHTVLDGLAVLTVATRCDNAHVARLAFRRPPDGNLHLTPIWTTPRQPTNT